VSDPRYIREIGKFLPILDQASISVARAQVRELGAELTLDSSLIEQVAIIASELTQNQLAHAKRGEFLVKPAFRNGVAGLEVIAKDSGPGIMDPRSALRGDCSSSGSLGPGLASVNGLCDELDCDIRLGQGTCVWARTFAKPVNGLCRELALLGRPCDGEVVSGDAGGFVRSETGFLACVADGLGHGLLAHRASSQAVAIVSENPALSIPEILTKCDRGLTDTRGAVMSLVRFDSSAQRVECGAVGDV
jgi:anti-sigma regulatory factor (Ser/Thr protein kinase)